MKAHTPKVSRCPACIPRYVGFIGMHQHQRTPEERMNCILCHGSQKVPTAVAARYVATINGLIVPDA